MNVWIIYKTGIGFPRIIAEMLQEHLENYMDINVGCAEKIDPAYLIEERVDYLIVGDDMSKEIPSIEILNWLIKYRGISRDNNYIVKVLSGFYIVPSNLKVLPVWNESLQENINADFIYPSIIGLKLKKAEFTLESRALDVVKAYSKDILDFFLRNEIKLSEE